MQTIALNLGATYAGATLSADILDADDAVLSTLTTGYTDLGRGSYVWDMEIPAAAIAVRIYDATSTLLVVAVNGADELAVSGDLLAGFKAYIRLADDTSQDATLSLLLLSAITELSDIAGRAVSTTEPRIRLWIYARAAGMFTHPEAHTDRPVTESKAFGMLTDNLKGYTVG